MTAKAESSFAPTLGAGCILHIPRLDAGAAAAHDALYDMYGVYQVSSIYSYY